jgi:cystathionine beta-lyase
VDVRAYGKSNDALMKCCYQHGVALNNGALFGEEAGEGFMRLNFGCPRTQLLEGMERFAAAVKHQ